jgi:hypothetical protein
MDAGNDRLASRLRCREQATPDGDRRLWAVCFGRFLAELLQQRRQIPGGLSNWLATIAQVIEDGAQVQVDLGQDLLDVCGVARGAAEPQRNQHMVLQQCGVHLLMTHQA